MGKENTKGMGITDMPCTSEEEDLLEISKYVKGLGKFIRECQTPMSIAIQVHWKRNPTTCRLCLGGTFLSVKRLNYRQR